MTAPLSPGTHVIYCGRVRSEYAESYVIGGPCDCRDCPGGDTPRYRLLHATRRGYEMLHVGERHVMRADGSHPWQINLRILGAAGVDAVDDL